MTHPPQPANHTLRFTARLPLWFILTAPFITILVVAVILSSYLTFRNSHAAVNTIAEQLIGEINARIDAHLETFLQVPRRINLSTANAIRRGELDPTNMEAVKRHVWQEVQVYDSVNSIYLGNPRGGLISGGREGTDGSLYVMTTPDFASGPITKYATDAEGNPGETVAFVPAFDSRVRPWYTGAVERQGANWTAPYVLSTGQDLAIASSLPVYDDDGTLLAVASVDIFISHISSFLRSMQIGKMGQAYIVDQAGLLVTASRDTPLAIQQGGADWQRLPARQSADPEIATTARYVQDELGGFAAIERQERFQIAINGQQHYLWITPYQDPAGLNWFVVVSIPERDFFATIDDQNRVTAWLTVLASLIAVIVGIVTALQVSRPVSRLSRAAAAIARGNWSQTVPVEGAKEVRRLGESFNMMSAQLYEVFNHLEERVRARTKELAASEARYRGIVEDQTELICRFLPDGTRLTFVNQAYCRYFDKTPEELIGQSFMPHIPPEDHAMLEGHFAQLEQEGAAITIEHRVITPDDSIRWLQWVNRALLDAQGRMIEIQSVGRDITAHKQFEQTLQKALAHETELNELKTHFISTVSHEFRTPMTTILNASELLERYWDRLEPEKRTVYFERINNQIQYMTHLLQEVLTINRAEHGKLEFNPQVVNVAAMCRSVVNEIRTTAETSVAVDYTLEGDCSAVVADIKLLRLVITNLVSNAIKYSPPESTVSIGLRCNADHMIFWITDQGIGIPQDAQTRIFEPFFRAGNVDTTPGTGLGLAIVKQSVERHEGTIAFQSELGKGTTFVVTFPHSVLTERKHG